jgi:hypothetical protein
VGLLPLAYLGVELPEAKMTVGHERPHPQLVGQGEGLAVVISGLLALRRLAPRGDLTASEIDGLLNCIVLLWQMRQGAERLLEGPHSVAVGRPRHRLLPRLLSVCQGLVPHFSPQGMMGQALELLGHPISGERLQGRGNAGVERAAALGAASRRPLAG